MRSTRKGHAWRGDPRLLSCTSFQSLCFSLGTQEGHDLLNDFLMRNSRRCIRKRLFDAGAEPLFITGVRFADILAPSRIDLLFRLGIFIAEKVLDKPVEVAGGQLTGVFEDFGGCALHGEIVARNPVRPHAEISPMVAGHRYQAMVSR